ncbi:winged helix-turn-helix transcriptional regulator [Crystallibacter degradans]|uniref:winged helix-turn-helix transcriptional regulator n=1 Tax=Crystallibacter degradans TaxID=2726743 RepID=UPI0014739D04|nr:helix-turn-helix domain-containing protein [Arthrobacter sp. SF27]NMR29197.1 helix-turn-helix transcriptional regulator [Arthrobacter sp. SF27]
MLGKMYESQVCSIARALEVVGERWSLLIVRDALFAGVTRFNDFQHNLGIATNVLQSRLDAFLAAGIMERRQVSEQPAQHEYLLTAKGRDLAPALIALTQWGDRWAAPGEPPILYDHSACGEEVRQATVCAKCGPIDPAEVKVRIGPGMPAEYLKNRRPRRPA